MRTVYKKPLTIKQQSVYLGENKRVRYNIISETDAQQILYTCNYINVISPYKHFFAKADPKTYETIWDANHKHIYEKDVEFSEYLGAYRYERENYTNIYKHIMKFESTLNAIVSYEVINAFQIDTYEKFIYFRDQLLINAKEASPNPEAVCHMRDEINGFYNSMKRYEDIYIFMDRLSLSEIITVWRCCGKRLRDKIFTSMQNANETFGYASFGTFNDFLKRIVPIRNCICHFNSLEILINYYDIKAHELRSSSDKKSYVNIITKLSA